MSNFKIYTDGAATMRKVNGEYVREAGGWSYIILDGNEKEICGAYGGNPQTTNNAMELTAIKEGLQRFLTFGYRGEGISVYSDSAYCINIFTQWVEGWKKNGWTRGKKHEPIENLELVKDIYNLIQECKRCFCEVTFVKVKGHAGDYWNEKVDHFAVQGKLNAGGEGVFKKPTAEVAARLEEEKEKSEREEDYMCPGFFI